MTGKRILHEATVAILTMVASFFVIDSSILRLNINDPIDQLLALLVIAIVYGLIRTLLARFTRS